MERLKERSRSRIDASGRRDRCPYCRLIGCFTARNLCLSFPNSPLEDSSRGLLLLSLLLDPASLSLLGLGLWWRCHSLSRKCHDEINPPLRNRTNYFAPFDRHCKSLDEVSAPLYFENVPRSIQERNILY